MLNEYAEYYLVKTAGDSLQSLVQQQRPSPTFPGPATVDRGFAPIGPQGPYDTRETKRPPQTFLDRLMDLHFPWVADR